LARLLWIGPALEEALRPLAHVDARIPRLVMLGASGYTVALGLLLILAVVAAGTLVRIRASILGGRLLLGLAISLALSCFLLEGSAVVAARAADPVDFGADGVTRCPCPDDLLVSQGSACGCNEDGQVVVVLLDKDFDEQVDQRCRCTVPPSGEETCAMRCDPVR
jgi:hypothetical protein